jgi:hypothetical protein
MLPIRFLRAVFAPRRLALEVDIEEFALDWREVIGLWLAIAVQISLFTRTGTFWIISELPVKVSSGPKMAW